MPHSRDETLALLRGQTIQRLPVFSGLPSLTMPGLQAVGIRYSEAHTDPTKMAAAAASTFELCRFESAVVPFDLCVEAEALGCHVDFQTDLDIFMPPVVDVPLSPDRWQRAFPVDLANTGRTAVVAEAVRVLKIGVGREIAIGAWIPGPFTLAWQMFGADAWLSITKDDTRAQGILARASDFLARVAQFYARAGADFLTVHEMGGSPQVIGADAFRSLVKPSLVRLFGQLAPPNVLSVCGNTNSVVPELAQCGADAISVDQQNDIARTRQMLPKAVLLGNLDPVRTLSQGTPEDVRNAAEKAARDGVSAIWPGCDLYPEIPEANLRSLMSVAEKTLPS